MRKLFLFSFLVFAFGCSDNMPVEPEVDLSPDLAVAQAEGGMGVIASVAGSGHFSPFDDDINSFMFNAKEKADGTVKGQATLQIRVMGTFWKLDIDCLAVSGNQAVVSGVVSQTSTPWVGIGGWFAMEDNGEGGDSQPDKISGFWGIPPYAYPDPGFCHEAVQDINAYLEPYPFGWKDVIRGNVQVNGGDLF